ncbi:MAG: hypothetical protein HC778_01350 [Chamaesiphon sp. CSU_1_12]|nr:hypothetical protein [Chamaesiphon sp. CSU_1_12]
MESSTDHNIDPKGEIASIAEEIYICVEDGDIAGAIRHLVGVASRNENRAIFFIPIALIFMPSVLIFIPKSARSIEQLPTTIPLSRTLRERAIELQPHNRLFQHWRSQLNSWTWGLELRDDY